jgi:hypothetical protein
VRVGVATASSALLIYLFVFTLRPILAFSAAPWLPIRAASEVRLGYEIPERLKLNTNLVPTKLNDNQQQGPNTYGLCHRHPGNRKNLHRSNRLFPNHL